MLHPELHFENVRTKSFILFLFLFVTTMLSAATTPIKNGFLQSDFNGNGYSITNLGGLNVTNLHAINLTVDNTNLIGSVTISTNGVPIAIPATNINFTDFFVGPSSNNGAATIDLGAAPTTSLVNSASNILANLSGGFHVLIGSNFTTAQIQSIRSIA